MKLNRFWVLLFALLGAGPVWASGNLHMISHPLAITAVVLFVLAYALVIAEEFIHIRKSKPVILAAGIIWVLVAIVAGSVEGGPELLDEAVDHNVNEYAALFLFLLTAMIYINALTERNVFEKLRSVLVQKGYSFRTPGVPMAARMRFA